MHVCDVFLAICRVVCAKVVGATSIEGFLIFKIKFGERVVRLDSGNNRFSFGKSQKFTVMFPVLFFSYNGGQTTKDIRKISTTFCTATQLVVTITNGQSNST